ncbi:hypothetical protein Goari_018311 [Gossypium aridum]|uniref:RNase H type-1 domain-containing protein n=1 Tax=Gossypium aridum TaxID=34290 RepID=A0A7J8WPQ5_GOSAI|nr:hypothetical protein [Gossypium aridum]
MEGKKITRQSTHITWNPSLRATMKINFDETFDGNNARSALGVVVKNALREVVASKEINHRSVLMPFTAEAHCKRLFHRIDFQYVPKTANHLTHLIATESMRRGEEAYCEGDVPGFVKKTLDQRRPRALD